MNTRFSKTFRSAAVVSALGLSFAVSLFSGSLLAQFSDKESVITFSAPFEIPGTNPQVLPAGTYRLRIVDSKSEPHIVQISNREDSHVYSTIMAIPAHRDVATKETVMTFQERGFGQPEALQRWFYPHDKDGEEFVYPKPAPQIARSAPVAETPAPAPVVVEPPQPEVAVAAPPAPAPEPAPRVEATPVPASAPAEPPAAAAPPQEPPQPPAALPHTASNLPLLALVGILFIGFGLAVGQLRRR